MFLPILSGAGPHWVVGVLIAVALWALFLGLPLYMLGSLAECAAC